ncbi:helix-turn-helix transcriptional regulator [Brevibacillus sp. HD1.4A]|uniref:helix-turn-helix domain-containing protein n=1 Tax=Brevibacillus sp. HD1.4A TaxID=2738978 RepID=UPI00156BA050|nr:helix-turn-helix transcriptional regulator [Brevibacillus sp. HD1.4A]NRQ56082.1 helix-turn-helix transcriptional regulator [Brevibacillus sp. HD1.4A]
MRIHERVRGYIYDNGMKLNFVAEKAGIKQKRFYRIINGDTPMTAEEYESICRFGLSLNPGYFFTDLFLDSKKSTQKPA